VGEHLEKFSSHFIDFNIQKFWHTTTIGANWK